MILIKLLVNSGSHLICLFFALEHCIR
jgi:hypothetical protein